MPRSILVKIIDLYKYDYAPTRAEIRLKITKNKMELKRQISDLYKDNNVKDLIQLQTVIRDLDYTNDGTLGYIDHQYFRKLDLAGGDVTYEDNWQEFFFFISSKYNLLIIGGGAKEIRNSAKKTLIEFLSEDISVLSTFNVKTPKLRQLVEKIKSHGSKDSETKESKNIMTDVSWYTPNVKNMDGAKKQQTNMFRNYKGSKCASKHADFERNMKNSETFDTIMRIHRCNGIMPNESMVGYELHLEPKCSFLCTTDPTPNQWVLFVLETCKSTLDLKSK